MPYIDPRTHFLFSSRPSEAIQKLINLIGDTHTREVISTVYDLVVICFQVVIFGVGMPFVLNADSIAFFELYYWKRRFWVCLCVAPSTRLPETEIEAYLAYRAEISTYVNYSGIGNNNRELLLPAHTNSTTTATNNSQVAVNEAFQRAKALAKSSFTLDLNAVRRNQETPRNIGDTAMRGREKEEEMTLTGVSRYETSH